MSASAESSRRAAAPLVLRLGAATPLLALLLILPAAAGQRVDATGDATVHGFDGEFGYGYSLGYLRSFPLTRRISLWYGLEAASAPAQRVFHYSGETYGSKLQGTHVGLASDSRLYYAGVPAEFRLDFTTSRIRPYLAHGYRLHARVFETGARPDSATFRFCRDRLQPRPTCLEEEDFTESLHHPLVLRTGLTFGVAATFGAWSPYLEAGIRFDLTPARERVPLTTLRTRSLVGGFGIGF